MKRAEALRQASMALSTGGFKGDDGKNLFTYVIRRSGRPIEIGDAGAD